jgi:hypothetical protein
MNCIFSHTNDVQYKKKLLGRIRRYMLRVNVAQHDLTYRAIGGVL